MHCLYTAIALAAALALAACGKATEVATEKAAEKMIEAQLAKEGKQASVDMSSGGMKITTTDASGRTTQASIGNTPVGEADVGVPFYPGAKPAEGASTRIQTADGTATTVMLESKDAPDKVAAFYRDKLKAQSEGKQFMDLTSNEGATLILADDKAKSGTQVQVMKAEGGGTQVHIMATRGPAK